MKAGYFRGRKGRVTSWLTAAVLLTAAFIPPAAAGCARNEPARDAAAAAGAPVPDTAQADPGGVETTSEAEVAPEPDIPSFDPTLPLVIESGNPNRKEVALTIDDGWGRDDRILDLLERYGITCTVFVIGGRGVAEADPEWIRRMDRDGFEVCTHTYSHYKLTDHPKEWIYEDIRKGQDVIAVVTAKRYPYMRPPGGYVNDAVRAAAAESGCHIIMWSNAFGDTDQNATVESEISAVLSRLRNGDIILCHFGGYHTYEALQRLVPEIQSRGYRFVTLSDLLAQ